jgi:hypothetical protein
VADAVTPPPKPAFQRDGVHRPIMHGRGWVSRCRR